MSKLWIVAALAATACTPKQPTSSTPAPTPAPNPTPTPPPGDTPTDNGPICGTRGAAACEAPNYCQFDLGAQCGAADRPGHCVKRPEMCAEIYQPVCGCDGKTYGNACSAGIAGVGVMSEGKCP